MLLSHLAHSLAITKVGQPAADLHALNAQGGYHMLGRCSAAYVACLLDFRLCAGGWGKPPVDEFGRPIYGNVFGVDEEEVDEDELVSIR